MERRSINPWSWQDRFGYVQANEVRGMERMLLCSGQGAVDAAGHPLHPSDMHAQLAAALDNLETVLKAAGFTLGDVVRLNVYTTDVDQFFAASAGVGPRLAAAGCQATTTLVGVTRLAFPEL